MSKQIEKDAYLSQNMTVNTSKHQKKANIHKSNSKQITFCIGGVYLFTLKRLILAIMAKISQVKAASLIWP